MRHYLFLSVLLVATTASAVNHLSDQNIKQLPCGKKIVQILTQWKVQSAWRKKFTLDKNEFKFQTPTASLGQWVQIQWKDNKSIVLTQFSENSSQQIYFNSKCDSEVRPELKTRKPTETKEDSVNSRFPIFNDENLKKLIDEKKTAVIYIWTPHMQVAIEGLKEIFKATEKLKVPLYAVVDPNSHGEVTEKLIQDLNIPKSNIYVFDSFELSLRDFRLHFPSLITIDKGQFVTPVQRGLETADVYEGFIQSHLIKGS